MTKLMNVHDYNIFDIKVKKKTSIDESLKKIVPIYLFIKIYPKKKNQINWWPSLPSSSSSSSCSL